MSLDPENLLLLLITVAAVAAAVFVGALGKDYPTAVFAALFGLIAGFSLALAIYRSHG